jgi:MoxR-like ATPase
MINLLHYDAHCEIAELAIHAHEHMLLVGPPGTAKSLFARQMFAYFDARTFFTQLSKFADESAVFGPLNIAALKKGKFEFCAERTLLDAELAFLDEVFDASDVLLRAMLGVLNEREFQRGSFAVRCPLVTCIATANYTRYNEITEAVVDRFLFQTSSPQLSQQQRAQLYDGIDYEHVLSVERRPLPPPRAPSATIPTEIVETLLALAQDLGLTPRRERKIARALKIRAELNGRQHVDPSDLSIFRYCVPLEKQTPDLTQRIDETAKRLASERQQLEQIEAISWSEAVSVDGARSCLAAIKKLQKIAPCSETVRVKKDERLNAAQSRHCATLKELGVLQ